MREFFLVYSIVAQSRIIDKIYLISWLDKVLLFDEVTFWVSYFFRVSTFKGPLLFLKQLYVFTRATFSDDELHFRKSNFRLIDNLVFKVTFTIYHLLIDSTNTGVFRHKLSGGAQSGCTTQKIFLLNTMNRNFASNLLSQGSIEQDYLPKNVKTFSFWVV